MSDPPVRARPRGIRKSKLNVESELRGRVGALEEELLAPDAGCSATKARSWAAETDVSFIVAGRAWELWRAEKCDHVQSTMGWDELIVAVSFCSSDVRL